MFLDGISESEFREMMNSDKSAALAILQRELNTTKAVLYHMREIIGLLGEDAGFSDGVARFNLIRLWLEHMIQKISR